MKHFTLLICSLLMAVFATAQNEPMGTLPKTKTEFQTTGVKIKKGETPALRQRKAYISERPEGELKTYKRSGQQYFEDWDGIYLGQQSGAANIIFGENNKVYLENVIYQINSGRWTEGTLSEDGKTITIAPGQIVEDYGGYVYDEELEDYISIEGQLMLTMMKIAVTEEGYNTFVPDPDTPITYTIDGDVIRLNNTEVDKEILGIIYTNYDEKYGLNGTWYGGGDFGTTYTLFNDTPLTLPDGAEPQAYSMSSKNLYTEEIETRLVQVAFCGNDVYMGNFTEALPDAWVKGTIEGDKITFPSKQFIGNAYGYLCYFMGATYEMVPSEWGEGFDVSYTLADAFVFDFDAGTKAMKASKENTAFMASSGDNTTISFNSYNNPVMSPYVEKAATPAEPIIDGIYDYYEWEGDYCISFRVQKMDVDGNYINPDLLSFILYVDGQPYTFDAEKYELEEDMTEIPFTYSGSSFFVMGDWSSIYLQEEKFEKIGIQAIYRGGGEERRSEINEFIYDGINSLKADKQNGKRFNLQGVQVDENYKGIVIQNGKKFLAK